MFFPELVDSFKYELYFETEAHPLCQHFMCKGVEDRRQITLSSLKEEICDICQKDLAGFTAEVAVYHIGGDIARCKSFRHAPVGIGFTDRAEQVILFYQAPDLFDIHDDPLMQETHIDASGTFFVAAEAIRLQYQDKVSLITGFTLLSGRGRFHPGIET